MKFFPTLVLVSALSLLAGSARAGIIDYGTADPFAVLGEAGVTNTGPSLIYGSLAGSTGTPSVTGFPPGAVEPPGVLYRTGVANSGPGTPFGDASAASLYADGLHGINEGTVSLGAGGLSSLTPGVYSFTSTTVLLNGTLQLDAGGSDDASWVFQIPFALTTGSASNVEVVDTGSAGLFTGSITWVVGSAATINGTGGGVMVGTIIASAGVTFSTADNTVQTVLDGRAIGLNASVTMVDTTINVPAP